MVEKESSKFSFKNKKFRYSLIIIVIIVPVICVSIFMVLQISTTYEEFDPDAEWIVKGSLKIMLSDDTHHGDVWLVRLPGGNYSIYFVDVFIDYKPECYVFLSNQTSFKQPPPYDLGEFVDLGLLPNFIGNFSVSIPNTVDITKYTSVVIWFKPLGLVHTYARWYIWSLEL